MTQPWSTRAGIAAGHPETARAGLEILEDGGTAADAAVAAVLASCVAETVMTGIAGGGHAVWWDGERSSHLDFFVAVPGIDLRRAPAPPTEVGIAFGQATVPYAVGIATCAVPGVPAGVEELWRRGGRLPWARLCEPARLLARDGVEMPPAHAACLDMLAPVMTLDQGSRIYAPGGRLLGPGDRLHQPGLARVLELLADEGARTFYEGSVARAVLEVMDERGGLVTASDLVAYRPTWHEPERLTYRNVEVLTRGGLAGIVQTLAALPPLRGASPADRALGLVAALSGPAAGSGTTNLSVVDAEGRACVVTTSLALGTGDFVPGLDVHLNSMLGEAALLPDGGEPGERMESMMAPSMALDRGGLVLAAGSAGGTRLRSALVQVLAGILDEELDPLEAVVRPRLHPVGSHVHAEPGLPEEGLAALEQRGFTVERWPSLHHYFGGASVVARAGVAADPRRDGLALTLAS